MNGYTFKCSSSIIVIFASLVSGSQLQEERNFSIMSKVFPLGQDPFWRGFSVRGSKEMSQKLFPFVKMDTKHKGVPILLKEYSRSSMAQTPLEP